ncbi:hypothetical protein BH10PSE3_BH10PSE3_05020 [soil metagenome]
MVDTRREKNRAKILESAKGLFLEFGFERTSMDEISARAAVSKTTLYAHFSDKTELFLAVVDLGGAELQANIARLTMDSHLSCAQKLEQLALQVLSATTADDVLDLLRIAISDRGRNERLAHIFSRSSEKLLLNAVATILFEDQEKGRYAATFEDALLESRLYLRITVNSIYIDVLLDKGYRPSPDVLRPYLALATEVFMNSRAILMLHNLRERFSQNLP